MEECTEDCRAEDRSEHRGRRGAETKRRGRVGEGDADGVEPFDAQGKNSRLRIAQIH